MQILFCPQYFSTWVVLAAFDFFLGFLFTISYHILQHIFQIFSSLKQWELKLWLESLSLSVFFLLVHIKDVVSLFSQIIARWIPINIIIRSLHCSKSLRSLHASTFITILTATPHRLWFHSLLTCFWTSDELFDTFSNKVVWIARKMCFGAELSL